MKKEGIEFKHCAVLSHMISITSVWVAIIND